MAVGRAEKRSSRYVIDAVEVRLLHNYRQLAMSKSKSPAPPKATVEFKVGDIVLAKVKGFSAWPSVVRKGSFRVSS